MNKTSAIRSAAFVLSTLVAAGFTSLAAAAEPASTAVTQHAQTGLYRYQLGDFEITVLSDGSVPQDLHALLKGGSQPEVDGLLARSFLASPVEASINAFLIDTGSRLVLVDVGAGDFFGPGYGGKLLGRLRAAGKSPADITDILLTHVHTDHSGGLVHEGKAVFPKAALHVGQPDVDFFLAPAHQQGVGGYDKAYFAQATAALTPYKASGQLQPFSGVTTLLPGITAIPTPGHTPGHAFYRVEGRGQAITFIGDVVHVQAVQFPQPAITITYDVDQPAAAQQRQAQFEKLASDRALVAAPHLPFPGLGHVRQEKTGFSFVPVDHHDRDGQ
ncbi:MBL fold metallo-hydrolase [Ideonella azotifigens]|nr:MBL fold metallo-hydrolase [Ideonella azotifigens]MCD2340405.1 MBL fold metallo-hydrolase [Ideonella azotifigens]